MSIDDFGNNRQRVAAELKRVREAAGLSQEQMATRLGMAYAPGGRPVSTGRAAVSAWERGRRTPPAGRLRIYVDLAGDPAILRDLTSDVVVTEPGAGNESTSSAPAELEMESGRLAWRNLRGRW